MKKEFTPRFKENIIETLDIKQMIGKYLVDDICETWTEDFIDDDTKEVVTVNRTQVLVTGHKKVTQDMASKISFHIQAGEITKPVKLTDICRTSYTDSTFIYRPMKVQFSNGLKQNSLLLWANSIHHAIDVATDFLEQIGDGYFYIKKVSMIFDVLIDKQEFYDKQMEQAQNCDLVLNPMKFYTVDVMWKGQGTSYPFVNPSKEARENIRSRTFICMADSLDEAKEIVAPEISKAAYEDDNWKDIEVHWVKGSPYNAGMIIPKSFCDDYCEYFKALNK